MSADNSDLMALSPSVLSDKSIDNVVYAPSPIPYLHVLKGWQLAKVSLVSCLLDQMQHRHCTVNVHLVNVNAALLPLMRCTDLCFPTHSTCIYTINPS